MNNKVVHKKQAKKKFVIHEEFGDNDGEDLFLVVLILLTDQSMANKCKGIGLFNFKLKDKEKNPICLFDLAVGQLLSIEVPVYCTKDSTISVNENIRNMIRENYYQVALHIRSFQACYNLVKLVV